MSTTAQITNLGLTQISNAVQGVAGTSSSPTITYIAVGTGIGLLSSSLSNGTNYSSLTLQSGAPSGVANGTSLTLVNGANTQTVTLSSAINQGDTVIHVNSFNANNNYPIGSGVVTTPVATDSQLNNEVLRKATATITPGANPGEALFTMYISPTDGSPPVTYLEIGWFAGNASSTLGTGILMARAVYWYAHTSGDSGTAQLDLTI